MAKKHEVTITVTERVSGDVIETKSSSFFSKYNADSFIFDVSDQYSEKPNINIDVDFRKVGT